jgi:LysR family transcriptional regulator, regulator for bpeEF and oprC
LDKLKALKYLRAAAATKTFSGAARNLGVSVPAVAKMISALERELGLPLFERTTHGSLLTAAGAAYLEACGPALTRLEDADEQVRALRSRLSGRLVIGVQHVIARGCFSDALPRFHARYPDIELDIRHVDTETEAGVPGIDLLLVLGWPKASDLVCRQLGAGRYCVVASPGYWLTQGAPTHPVDLERHNCLTVRGIDGAVMDVWNFVHPSGEQVSVLARGWLTTSHAHRDLFIDLAVAGHGVLRILDWINRSELGSGRLVRVLPDWESTEAVPVNLLFAPGVRRLPRARAFIDFISEVFAGFDRERGMPVEGTERPAWMRRSHGRASELELRPRPQTDARAQADDSRRR